MSIYTKYELDSLLRYRLGCMLSAKMRSLAKHPGPELWLLVCLRFKTVCVLLPSGTMHSKSSVSIFYFWSFLELLMGSQ